MITKYIENVLKKLWQQKNNGIQSFFNSISIIIVSYLFYLVFFDQIEIVISALFYLAFFDLFLLAKMLAKNQTKR